jgi:hypothetical protein
MDHTRTRRRYRILPTLAAAIVAGEVGWILVSRV